MKWKLTEDSWFRKVCLWAWWEIVSNAALAVALATMLIVANMMNGLALAGAIAIATGIVIWHFGWMKKTIREYLLIVLVGFVLGPLAVCAGFAIGTHKAEGWSKSVTYDFSPEKKKAEEPKKKEEKKKYIDPGLGEYFDGQFAKLREEMNGIRGEVKGVRSEVDGMKKRLKIDFQSEDEPLDFPGITAEPEPKKKVPDPPTEESGPRRLFKIAPDLPDEEPLPVERKKPEPKEPSKFQRPAPKSPGENAPKFPRITKVAKIVESECSFGKKHSITQFCEGEDGRLRFVDEARDRCKDESGKLCVCLRWIHEDETP